MTLTRRALFVRVGQALLAVVAGAAARLWMREQTVALEFVAALHAALVRDRLVAGARLQAASHALGTLVSLDGDPVGILPADRLPRGRAPESLAIRVAHVGRDARGRTELTVTVS
jgi:hypothetical protein